MGVVEDRKIDARDANRRRTRSSPYLGHFRRRVYDKGPARSLTSALSALSRQRPSPDLDVWTPLLRVEFASPPELHLAAHRDGMAAYSFHCTLADPE